jgi:hypothetical protein
MQQRDGNAFIPGALGALMLGVDEDGLYAPISVPVITTPAPTLKAGQATVSLVGTEVPLSAVSAKLRNGVTVKAHETNDGVVYIGPAGVSSLTGFKLAPGESILVPVTDLSLVYVDAVVSSDGVSFIGY